MANRIEGVEERILDVAKKEFLEKGFENASLRSIASLASTSTNSIYVRFGDKEGLFTALVAPVTDEYVRRFSQLQETFSSYPKERQRSEMEVYARQEYLKLIDFVYERHDEFRLLLDASYQKQYQEFIGKLVSIEAAYTGKWLASTENHFAEQPAISEELYNSAMTFYFHETFEVIRQDMSLEKAKAYLSMISKYHHAGFLALIGE